MASFATMDAAEARAVLKMGDGTWINAYAARQFDGTICVRIQRPMSPTNPDYGAWVELTDDSQT